MTNVLLFISYILGMGLSVISGPNVMHTIRYWHTPRPGDHSAIIALITVVLGIPLTFVGAYFLYAEIRIFAMVAHVFVYVIVYGFAIRLATR